MLTFTEFRDVLAAKVFNRFFLSATVFAAILISSCSENKTKPVSNGDFEMRIDSVVPAKFNTGDTVALHGANFGSPDCKEVAFGEIAVSGNDAISWEPEKILIEAPPEIESSSMKIIHSSSNSAPYETKRHILIDALDMFITASLFVTIIFIYLKINKIWKRKHDISVADSQSLAGLSIYIINCILWVFYYIFIETDLKSVLDNAIYILEGSVFFLIGTGLFVKGHEKYGFIALIKRSLRLERSEADYLLKKFFKPKNPELIIDILHQIAMIDEELDKSEEELIKSFAKEWKIPYDPNELDLNRFVSKEDNMYRLRLSVEEYLDSEPHPKQAAQVRDLIITLIKADQKVSLEEKLIMNELEGMFDNFLNKEENGERYTSVVVPRDDQQLSKLKEIAPNLEETNSSGGTAYVIGSYYSRTFAEAICAGYRKADLFAVVCSAEEE